MTDRVHILGGDELDEQLLAEALGRTGISDYCERGLAIQNEDVDYANAVVDVPGGKAYILDNGRDVMLLADPRAGVELATDGVNHVFIYYDLNQSEGERIGYHVSSDGAPPAFPYLKIAEIDMGAGEVARQNQTAPVYRRDAITYKGNDIDSDGDGVVDAADTITSPNGPLSGDQLLATGTPLGDTRLTTGVGNTFALAETADGADWLAFDPATAELVLGSPETALRLGSGVDGGGHDLTNFESGFFNRVFLTAGTPNGLELNAGTGGGRPGLNPRVDGNTDYTDGLFYEIDAGEWVFGSAVQVRDELRAYQLTLGGGAGDGLVIEASHNGDAGLSPVLNGEIHYDRRLRYIATDNLWAFRDPLRVDEGLAVTGGTIDAAGQAAAFGPITIPAGDDGGVELNASGGSGDLTLTPISGGEPQYDRGLKYLSGRDLWAFRDPLRVDGPLDVNGDRFSLPTVTADPSDTEPGDMWFRTDL